MNISKSKRIALFILSCFLFLCICVVSVSSQTLDPQTPSQQITSTNVDESAIQIPDQNETFPIDATTENDNTGWLFARMIIVLVIVIICIYALIRFLKKGMGVKANDDDYLKNVSTLSLGPAKSVHVITLGNDAYLIGATDTSINLIGKIEDPQLVNAMNLNADKQKVASKKVKDFASMLASFIPAKHDLQSEVQDFDNEEIDNDVDSATNFIKQQKNRLKSKNISNEDSIKSTNEDSL